MSQTPARTDPVRNGPLSNAERQRRWRERLKAKASGAAVVDHVRDVVARAIEALWAYHERPGPGGTAWAEIDGCHRIDDYLADLAAEEGGLRAAARAFAPSFEGLTPEEAQAVSALIELADVIGLRDDAGAGVLARLMAGRKQPPRIRRPKAEPRLELVTSAEPEPAEPEAPAEEPDQEALEDKSVRVTAARRARRRALLRKWR